MFKHILLPTDGSKLSEKAAKQAISIAQTAGAKITGIYVVNTYHLPHLKEDEGFLMPEIPMLRKRFEEAEAVLAKRILGRIQEAARKAGVSCDAVAPASDAPHEAIIKQAVKSKCDLIVMASHGRRGLEGVLLGSETQKVLTHSKIPVLVCR